MIVFRKTGNVIIFSLFSFPFLNFTTLKSKFREHNFHLCLFTSISNSAKYLQQLFRSILKKKANYSVQVLDMERKEIWYVNTPHSLSQNFSLWAYPVFLVGKHYLQLEGGKIPLCLHGLELQELAVWSCLESNRVPQSSLWSDCGIWTLVHKKTNLIKSRSSPFPKCPCTYCNRLQKQTKKLHVLTVASQWTFRCCKNCRNVTKIQVLVYSKCLGKLGGRGSTSWPLNTRNNAQADRTLFRSQAFVVVLFLTFQFRVHQLQDRESFHITKTPDRPRWSFFHFICFIILFHIKLAAVYVIEMWTLIQIHKKFYSRHISSDACVAK